MNDDWTTIAELKPGDLFEMLENNIGSVGSFWVRTGEVAKAAEAVNLYLCVCLSRDVMYSEKSAAWLYNHYRVRKLDLAFLLAIANDKLQENEAYSRGYQEGYQAHQREIADIAASVIKNASRP